MSRINLFLPLMILAGCGESELKPVEIFQEDACSFCRMAISDHRFAGEIITKESEVLKFDDLGCLLRFREERLEGDEAATFYMGYETGSWLHEDEAFVVQTGIMTPMGSGLVAFRDSLKASAFESEYPSESSK